MRLDTYDAARIVACVNACAGLSTKDLQMGVTLKFPRDEERSININTLRAQLAELAGALEECVLCLTDVVTRPDAPVLRNARAALAKVRPVDPADDDGPYDPTRAGGLYERLDDE